MPNDTPPARKRPSTGSVESPAAGAPRRRTTSQDQRTARPSSGAKLVCTAGPKSGSEFPLVEGAEMVIGRAAENAISIPDTSVSRRHVMIQRAEAGWSASDLGSGNGTLLNGDPLESETVLRNGDVLVLGDTELSFRDVENATDKRALPSGRRASMVDVPARRSQSGAAIARADGARPRVVRREAKKPDAKAQKRKRRLMLYGALFMVLTLGLFVGLKVKASREAEDQAAVAKRQAERKAQLGSIFQDAKNLVRQGNWEEAKGKFEQVKEIEPNYPSIEDYLARANKEIPNQKALAEAAAALKENKLGPAGLALAKVSGDTQIFERLRELKTQLDDKLVARLSDARQAAELAPKVSTPKDVSKWDEVIAITSDILMYLPDNRDAKVLKEQADSARAILTKPYVPPPPPPSRPWESAINLFIDGDLTGAFSVANACVSKAPRCKTLVQQMNEFQSLYKKVEELDAKGLGQMLSLDQKITEGRTSKMARSAGTRAATIYYKTASSSKAAGQWGRALEYALKALKAEPGHAPSAAIVSELRAKAKEIYLLGYSEKDTNPEEALAKFKEVVAMTPVDDETHQKAQRRLEEIGK